MHSLQLTARNFLLRRACAKVSQRDPYQRVVADFLGARSTPNASLEEAAEVFLAGYEQTVAAGEFVNELEILEEGEGGRVRFRDRNGREYLAANLSNNSYNDLEREPECREELLAYVASRELSSCLSRKIAGELPVHKELERELVSFLGLESCVLATSGYVAQMAAVFGLFRAGDVIFSDRHNHSSLVDGMRLSGATVIVYSHLDYGDLERKLQRHRHRFNAAGIVSDGVFSAHGTMADLDRIQELAERFRAVSVIDDTHGFATIGSRGRGALDHHRATPDILTASLAKGLAGFGGMIAGKRSLVKVIDMLGRQNVNTSHLSPVVAAQCLIHLRHYRRNLGAIRSELDGKIQLFNELLAREGLAAYEDASRYAHPIFSFGLGSEREAARAIRELFASGVLGAFFPPPVAPKPTLRLSLHRKVPEETLRGLACTLRRLGFRPLGREHWRAP